MSNMMHMEYEYGWHPYFRKSVRLWYGHFNTVPAARRVAEQMGFMFGPEQNDRSTLEKFFWDLTGKYLCGQHQLNEIEALLLFFLYGPRDPQGGDWGIEAKIQSGPSHELSAACNAFWADQAAAVRRIQEFPHNVNSEEGMGGVQMTGLFKGFGAKMYEANKKIFDGAIEGGEELNKEAAEFLSVEEAAQKGVSEGHKTMDAIRDNAAKKTAKNVAKVKTKRVRKSDINTNPAPPVEEKVPDLEAFEPKKTGPVDPAEKAVEDMLEGAVGDAKVNLDAADPPSGPRVIKPVGSS